ncbi:MAG: DUF2752 domain-containing protein [Kaistella sp.]
MVDPASSYFFPKCPFTYATGMYCPGCGSQRAVHELLHLNFANAFKQNALLVFSIPYILIGLAFNLDSVKERFPKIRKLLFGQRAIYVVLALVIAFFIFRNF